MAGSRPWTPHESQYLRDNYQTMTLEQIANSLGRTRPSVACRAAKLGLKKDLRCPSGEKWTPEQDQYIRDHWQKFSDEEIAAAVGHPVPSTRARRLKLGLKHRAGCKGPDWTQEELDYIREVWGDKTVPQIAKHLGRSVTAVKVKTARLGYIGQKWSGEMMSARKVSELLGVDVHTVCDFWIPKYGLKAKRRQLGVTKKTTTIIMFEDLLRWVEAHQDLWDSRRVEMYALGMEYDWLKEKRKADAEKPTRKAQKWTQQEDDRLITLFKRGGMTYAEIGAELGRPASGVEHRLQRLDVWGNGKYIGDAKRVQRKTTKENFERICFIIRLRDILLARRNSMDFGQYWQKNLCQMWNNVHGCTAGCTDCDSCTKFQRIRPQYCRMCGGEFLERAEQTYCPKCRAMRKKQAQRKYAILNRRRERRAV